MKETRRQKIDRQRGHQADRAFGGIRRAIDDGRLVVRSVPRCPTCFRNDNVRLLAAACDAEAPRDVWECSACARTFLESA